MLNIVSLKFKISCCAPGYLGIVWKPWMYNVWFPLYKVQKQAKLIKSVRSQERLPLEDSDCAGT